MGNTLVFFFVGFGTVGSSYSSENHGRFPSMLHYGYCQYFVDGVELIKSFFFLDFSPFSVWTTKKLYICPFLFGSETPSRSRSWQEGKSNEILKTLPKTNFLRIRSSAFVKDPNQSSFWGERKYYEIIFEGDVVLLTKIQQTTRK